VLALRPVSVLPLVATALVALALAAPADAKIPRGFVGISADDVFAGDDNYRTVNLSAMKAIGIQTIRQTFDWSTIERSRGVYDFSYHDAYVAKASAHGLRILPVLFNPPAFHRPTRGRAACPPRRMASFARFAKAVVRRYGRRGTLWKQRRDVPKNAITAYQIWNEPSLKIYWCNRRPNARRYVAMLRRVGRAIKRVDRRAHILTAGIPPSKLKTAVPIERYIARMYRAGARRHFDSLAINSYAKDRAQLRGLLRSMRGLMNRRGDRRGAIWITELGWGDAGPEHRLNVGPEGQARRIAQAFALIRKLRRPLRLSGVVYFRWRDVPPYPPNYDDQWGLHTGLIDINGGVKRAFDAFKDGVSALP
jgi:polysaccharide biosynthesis protein PslG